MAWAGYNYHNQTSRHFSRFFSTLEDTMHHLQPRLDGVVFPFTPRCLVSPADLLARSAHATFYGSRSQSSPPPLPLAPRQVRKDGQHGLTTHPSDGFGRSCTIVNSSLVYRNTALHGESGRRICQQRLHESPGPGFQFRVQLLLT